MSEAKEVPTEESEMKIETEEEIIEENSTKNSMLTESTESKLEEADLPDTKPLLKLDDKLKTKEPKLEPTPTIKKKREDKIRRRDSRALENLLKNMGTLADNEKFALLKTKYRELYDEYRKLQNQYMELEKRMKGVQRERENLGAECSKLILVKSRLESLCRELQKQNKIIKDEHLTKLQDEEQSRKKVAVKFETTLRELTNVMQDSTEKNTKLRDDNQDMANKIASLYTQFETGKQELARMEKQMSLEKQLSDATRTKLQIEFTAEKEQWMHEREILQKNLQKSEDNCKQLQEHMKVLDNHLLKYTGKYQEFETTINKSNQVFDDCKMEILKMTKQIATLEKELKVSRARGEKNAKTIVTLSSTKQLQEREIASNEKKIDQLQKLCRQLQVDRAAYLKLLKANNIEPSSQICMDSTPPAPTYKPTKKEQELSILKLNLKALQNQYAEIAGNKENELPEDETVKTEEIENDINERMVEEIVESIVAVACNNTPSDESTPKTESTNI